MRVTIIYIESFSALQRAENSSIRRHTKCCKRTKSVSVLFSEPKIPQSVWIAHPFWRARLSFSALQRAENSSMVRAYHALNDAAYRFSALQRAENSSIDAPHVEAVGVAGVSVLFSEPKIPQFFRAGGDNHSVTGFSALQRAENSSILSEKFSYRFINYVSVLFSEPKIPQ